MSRTLLLKIAYVLAIVCLGGVAAYVLGRYSYSFSATTVVVVSLLVPGRLQGFFYRELFNGRALLDRGQARESLVRFQRFLEQIRAAPWKRYLLWLSLSVYTTSAEAIVLNNIGTAHLAEGEGDLAQRFWEESSLHDAAYPLPVYNLAVLAAAPGDLKLADELRARALQLGFLGNSFDALVAKAQAVLAGIESRLPSSAA